MASISSFFLSCVCRAPPLDEVAPNPTSIPLLQLVECGADTGRKAQGAMPPHLLKYFGVNTNHCQRWGLPHSPHFPPVIEIHR